MKKERTNLVLLMEQAKSLSDEDLQKVIEYAELLKLKSNDKK